MKDTQYTVSDDQNVTVMNFSMPKPTYYNGVILKTAFCQQEAEKNYNQLVTSI